MPRIAEYGRFFFITEKIYARRPMLLAQRLDEVHFKGTILPIEQTFWREFGCIPVSWEPLYAPVNIENTPMELYFGDRNGNGLRHRPQFGEFFPDIWLVVKLIRTAISLIWRAG
uniref:Uncharacterized protein n=1 Tax=Salmonella sp. TaxID=599 RepID=A0A482EXF0_SALSP|nr:hypothetical protein [Salmonella sp.]QBM91545.1 hypothetical protein NNIBIDOC_00219 [Salmonella sp.]